MIHNLVHLSPSEVIRRRILMNVKPHQIQQVGIDLTLKEDLELQHGFTKNVEVNEVFNMQNCFGLTTIRSSYSRQGIFTTSGIYDPGFVGKGGLTLLNFSGFILRLPAGTPIAQIVIFQGAVEKTYDGVYNYSGSIDSKEDL